MPKAKQEKSPKKNNLSIEDLAVMIGKGFAATTTKADLAAVRAEIVGDMHKLETRLENRMYALHQEIKHDLKPLKEKAPNLEADITDHELRIKALERHTGIGK